MISTILLISSYILNIAGPKILFFTGGNSLMSDEIYSDFLSRLKQKYSVDTIQNSNKAHTIKFPLKSYQKSTKFTDQINIWLD